MSPDADIYPMPMFTTLSVSDIASAADWYKEVLAFSSVFEMPTVAHLRYRKYGDVLLVPAESDIDPDQRGRGVRIHFTVEGESVAEVAERARAADAAVSGPTETSHNTREVTITDPAGYTLVFSEPVDTTRTFENVMGVEYAGAGHRSTQSD